MQLWPSSPRCIIYWIFRRCGFTEQNSNELFVSWYRVNKQTFNWATSWRNLINVTIGGSSLDDCDIERCASTQFLQIQKNQLYDLQEHLELHSGLLTVFGFNSAKDALNLIKFYLLPILVYERDIKPIDIEKADKFIWFKFGDSQLLDIMKFHGGRASLDSALQAYKTSDTRVFFPTNGFITLTKCRIQNFLRMTLFTTNFVAVILLNQNTMTPLNYWEVEVPQNKPLSNQNYQSDHIQDLRTINTCNYHGSSKKWAHSKACCAGMKKRCCPTLGNVQKNDCHDKDIDMLKLGCTLPNRAHFCLHNCTDTKLYPFTEAETDLLDKIQGNVFGGPSIVFTRKSVVDETFVRKATNNCKPIFAIDASQLHWFSTSQTKPIGLFARWDHDPKTSKFTSPQDKTRSLKNKVMSYFQWTKSDCYTTDKQK